MSRLSIGILVAALAGVASVCFLPLGWILPAFGLGIAVALVAGIAARSNVQPHKPVHPAVDLALFAVNLPSDPLAKVSSGWPLWSFAVAASYVVSLCLAMLWAANA
jgi:hypothetical protein